MVTVMVMVACVTTSCAQPKPAGNKGVPYADPGKIVAVSDLLGSDQTLLAATSLAKRVTYTSRSAIDDSTTHVTGSVFVPRGNPAPGGWPIVALGRPLMGTSPGCAPSLNPTLLDVATVASLLDTGYVVAVTDYQGLGNPSGDATYHPYLDSTTAGYNMIDSVRAAHALVLGTSARWAAFGTSHGAQAAWAADELQQNYGSGLTLVGSASVSPIADVNGLADLAAAGTLTTGQKLMLPAFLAALKDEYGGEFYLDDYRRGIVEAEWNELLACRSPGLRQRGALADRMGPDDLRPSTPMATQTLRGYLKKSTLPQGPAAAPMLVEYGGADQLIPPAWTERALDYACRMGDVIEIQRQAERGHDDVDPSPAAHWLKERFEDVPTQNDCPSITSPNRSPG